MQRARRANQTLGKSWEGAKKAVHSLLEALSLTLQATNAPAKKDVEDAAGKASEQGARRFGSHHGKPPRKDLDMGTEETKLVRHRLGVVEPHHIGGGQRQTKPKICGFGLPQFRISGFGLGDRAV